METVAQPAGPPSSPARTNHGGLTSWLFGASAAACVLLGWLRQSRVAH